MAQEIERGFEIGKDAFGRRVTLSRRHHYTGRVMWKIVIHPDSQRDDGGQIDALSDENLREISSAMAQAK